MERKRAAMMDNAKQRDEDREESIRRHGNAKEDVTPVAASADFIKYVSSHSRLRNLETVYHRKIIYFSMQIVR